YLLNRLPRRWVPRAGVGQQHAAASENQIEERLFVVSAARLTQDVEVLVIRMRFPFRQRLTIGTAGSPMFRKRARLDPGARGLSLSVQPYHENRRAEEQLHSGSVASILRASIR